MDAYIQKMDWRSIDLNLLVVFRAILDQRGVTRAGEVLGLSQPAMSAALARLRDLFNDPLFVRSGTEMKPTAKALELDVPVRAVLEAIRTEVLQRSGFEPAATDRVFTIITPDIGEAHFVPALLDRLARLAPHASLRSIARAPVAAAAALESGEAQLAIGYFPDLRKAGFYQQKLFAIPHVCMLRRDHPLRGHHMRLEDFQAASHVVVRPDGRGHELDHILSPNRMPRKVVVEVSHFLSLPSILESSDLIAVVPLDMAGIAHRYDLRIMKLPFETTPMDIHQFWHDRFHKDPPNVWLRAQVHEICSAHARQLDRAPGERMPALTAQKV